MPPPQLMDNIGHEAGAQEEALEIRPDSPVPVQEVWVAFVTCVAWWTPLGACQAPLPSLLTTRLLLEPIPEAADEDTPPSASLERPHDSKS